jgi:predicted DNA-binding protein (UPF0251 family)
MAGRKLAKRDVYAKLAIDQLDTLDKAALAFYVQNPSITDTEVAKRLGISRNTLFERMKSPAFKLAHTEALLPAIDIFRAKAADAIRRHFRLAESSNENVAVKATSKVVDKVVPTTLALTGKDGGPLTIAVEPLSPAELVRAAALVAKAIKE